MARLEDWVACDRALDQLTLQEDPAVLKLLQASVSHKQELIVQSLLEILTAWQDHANVVAIAQAIKQLSPQVIANILEHEDWQTRLSPRISQALIEPAASATPPTISSQERLGHLESLLQHYNPLVQATALYLIAQLDTNRAQTIAHSLQESESWLVKTTADQLLALPPSPPLSSLPLLEKLVYLFNSDFFHHLQTETLIALSDRAEVKTYGAGNVITEAGDTCRELLLLIEGDANIYWRIAGELQIERVHSGQILDELEILTHSRSENTILAEHDQTRILAIPVDAVDDLLDRDPEFARRILNLEAQQLQRLVQSGHKLI